MAERGVREKAELRRRLREERLLKKRGADQDYRPVPTEDAADAYLPLGIERYRTLFTFLSLPEEPDTAPLNRLALGYGLIVAAPRVEGENLGFYRLHSASGPFALGPYGIREPLDTAEILWPPRPPESPQAPDAAASPPDAPPSPGLVFPLLVAVPGLAFTADGRRLGRGKGYYDRFLAAFLAAHASRREQITLLGLCPPGRLLEAIPTEAHDIRVDCLIAEKAYIITSDIR